MTLKRRIELIIKKHIANPAAMRAEIKALLKQQPPGKKMQEDELKQLITETRQQMERQFIEKNTSALDPKTAAALQTITKSAEYRFNTTDRLIIRKVDDALRNALTDGDPSNWREVARAALRPFRTAEHHIETEINTTRAALDNLSRITEVKQTQVKYLKYAGPSGTVRAFCRQHVGKIYTIEEVEAMVNQFNQPAAYYCGGYNCRHRWVPVTDPEPQKGTK